MTSDEFKAEVDLLWAQTKAGELPRQLRFEAVEALTERYIAVRNESPPPNQLDRLATLCLYEEVTDDDRMKSRNNESPILSDRQLDRREDGQVSFTLSEEVGTDGRDHRPQTRLNRRKLRQINSNKG